MAFPAVSLVARVSADHCSYRALSASRRCRSAASWAARAVALAAPVWSCWAAGVGGLLEGVGFGLRGEPQLAADVRRGGGAGAFALEGSCFELAAVQAADDVGFVADLQGGEDCFAHGFEFGLAAVRLG